MSRPRPPCHVCGDPSVVTVLARYQGGEPVFRRYCLRCAAGPEGGAGEIVYSYAPRVLLWTGAAIGLLSVSADFLRVTPHAGFGWRQFAGAEAGVLCMVLGAFFRVAVLSLAGAFLFALSVGFDQINLGHSLGIGWRQTVAALVALVLVGVGLWLQRRARAADSPAED